jgi:hypothetical protein
MFWALLLVILRVLAQSKVGVTELVELKLPATVREAPDANLKSPLPDRVILLAEKEPEPMIHG